MKLDKVQLMRIVDTMGKTIDQVSALPVSDAYPAAETAALWHSLVSLQDALSRLSIDLMRGAIVNPDAEQIMKDANTTLETVWGSNLARYRAAILSAEKGEQPVTERAKGPARVGSVVLPDSNFRASVLKVLDALKEYAKALVAIDWTQASDDLDEPVSNALGDVNTLIRDIGSGSVDITKRMANAVIEAGGDVAANAAKVPGKILGAGLKAIPWKEVGIALFATATVGAIIHFWPKSTPTRRTRVA